MSERHQRKMRSGKKTLRQGTLSLHRDGFGFVTSDREGEEDVFVPAPFIGAALPGDHVQVTVFEGRRGKFEGRIIKIISRHLEKLVGRLEQKGKIFELIPDDLRIRHRVIIPHEKKGQARHGQNVIVQILAYPDTGKPMMGGVLEVLGERGERETEIAAVVVRHQLPREFPKDVLHEASGCKMQGEEYQQRKDLRHLPFVTIDGETAMDFDDAVAVEPTKDGTMRLWVAIADVAHFVRSETPLDREAYKRGTSVYFPGTCLPMLPEALSNDLCSLRPDEDRFTMVACLDVALDGEIVAEDFFQGVIRSRRRMTYTEVRKIVLDQDPDARRAAGDIVREVEIMKSCFDRLRMKRIERGSIDFDLPEPQIVLDLQGEIEGIVKAERHVGHMMIEEFMVAANEAVARFLTLERRGCVYRIHESPDPKKLHEFSILLHNLGHRFRLGSGPSPKHLSQVLKLVQGRPEERLINHQLLRSMAKAVYSHENIGHYGLASPCYCHFTSPIRRYPDLVVHRLLKRAMVRTKEGEGRARASLYEVAEHCTQRERVATDAEREMLKLYAARFMQDKLDQEFDGVVAHVTKFGMYVELINFFVEGFIPLSALGTGHYRFDEKGMVLLGKKKEESLRIGDRVRISVAEINLTTREIRFALPSRNT